MKALYFSLILVLSSCGWQQIKSASNSNSNGSLAANTGSPATSTSKTFVNNNKISLGALVSEPDNPEQVGLAMKIAMNLAVEDINAEFTKNDQAARVSIDVRDANTTDKSIAAFKDLISSGEVKVLIGPDTSANLKIIEDLANEKKVVIVSPSATTPQLSKADDAICRLVPNDAYLAKVTAQLMKDKKVSNFVGLIRGDSDGSDAYQYSKEAFRRVGGTSNNSAVFSPVAGADYSKELNALAKFANIDAVQLVSFQEMVPIFALARKISELAKVPWFGTDGNAQINDLIKSPADADFAITVDFQAPAFSVPEDKKSDFDNFVKRIRDKAGSQIPVDIFAVIAYDAVMQAARVSAAVAQKSDSKEWVSKFIELSAKASGITGSLTVNEDCDRAGGNYAIWKVRKTKSDSYEWFIDKTVAVPSL